MRALPTIIIRHINLEPSWDDIQKVFSRLDGQTYPSLYLACEDKEISFPSMEVLGGPDEYTVSLERPRANGRGFERIRLINPSRYYNSDIKDWGGIGKSYHNYEVDVIYLTPDIKLIVTLIQYFPLMVTGTLMHLLLLRQRTKKVNGFNILSDIFYDFDFP